MACVARMLSISLLALFSQGQQLQDDCSALASPFTVRSTDDASTLAALILGCPDGAFAVQWVGEVFVAETIHVTNRTSLSVTGAGSSSIADGRNATQLFVVDRGSSLHFSDMTFAHGSASFGGAINAFEANVSFSGKASFVYNVAGDDGGAIFANHSTIFWDSDGIEFIFNSAGDDGGAIGAHASSVSWDGDGAQFISNSAGEDGGAIYAHHFSNVSWYGDGTHFISNFANSTNHGGAVFVTDFSNVFWNGDDTQFSSNVAGYYGGALAADYSTVSWDGDGTKFSNNSGGRGGAIYADNSAVLWGGNGTEFTSNSARIDGGAIEAWSSNLTWNGDGAQFRSNFALGSGGAIHAFEAHLSLDGDGIQFSYNSAAGGGAISVSSSMLYWNGEGANFRSNSAIEGRGGALYWKYSIVSWNGDGSQFTSNSAADGGAIYSDFATVLTWNGDGTLFSLNSANETGGAIAAGSDVLWNGDGTLLNSNSAVEGGAIAVSRQGNMSFRGDSIQFSSNFAGGNGGAISAYGSVFLGGNGTQFTSNSAGVHGGAIYLEGATMSWNGVQVSSNSAGSDGGAVYVTEGAIVRSDGNTTFSRNVAVENGGAVAAVENDELAPIFHGGRFIENSAANGGAIYLSFAIGFNLANITFHANSATGGSGGAVAAYSTGSGDLLTATFTRCNFSDNVSETGGAVETLAAQLQFDSCSFEGNSAGKERGSGSTADTGLLNLSDLWAPSVDSAICGVGGTSATNDQCLHLLQDPLV